MAKKILTNKHQFFNPKNKGKNPMKNQKKTAKKTAKKTSAKNVNTIVKKTSAKKLKPKTIPEQNKIVNLSDFFIILKKAISGINYLLCVAKKSIEKTSPFFLISEDSNIARKEGKDITSLCTFLGMDLDELNETIFSDIKRTKKGEYKINPLYSAILYPLFYRYDQAVILEGKSGVTSSQDNYLRMINRFISSDLYNLVSKDFDLTEDKKKNRFRIEDPSTGKITFSILKK